MTVDSQRSASAVHADRGESRANDAWLGPVLVAGGVLTPDQLAELGEIATTRWAAVVDAGLARRSGRPASSESGRATPLSTS